EKAVLLDPGKRSGAAYIEELTLDQCAHYYDDDHFYDDDTNTKSSKQTSVVMTAERKVPAETTTAAEMSRADFMEDLGELSHMPYLTRLTVIMLHRYIPPSDLKAESDPSSREVNLGNLEWADIRSDDRLGKHLPKLAVLRLAFVGENPGAGAGK